MLNLTLLYCLFLPQSDTLAVLDVRMGKQLKKLKFNYEINEMAWSYNSDHILVATGGQDMGGIDILRVDATADSADFVPVTAVGAHTSNCYCLKIDKSFRRMAVGSADFLVSLWNLEDMVCYNTITCMDSPIRALSFSSTGDYIIAAVAEGNNLVICDTQTAEQVVSIDCNSSLMALAWHPQHNLIAIAPDADTSDDSPRYRNDRKQYIQLVSFENSKK